MSPKMIAPAAALGLATAAAALVLSIPAGAQPRLAGAMTVTVTIGKPSEFGFRLSTKTFRHGTVTFKVTDRGALTHSFKVCSSPKGGTKNTCVGKGTPVLAPGVTKALVLTFKTKGSYEYLCTVLGHAAAGMKGLLKVT